MVSRINLWAAGFAGVALLVMATVGFASVVGNLFAAPLVGAYELTETLMVITIFLGFAAAQERKGHIAVELLVSRLGPRSRAGFGVTGAAMSLALFAFIAYFGWSSAYRSFMTSEHQAGQIAFPLGPSRLMLAIGATLMVVQCARDVLHGVYDVIRPRHSAAPSEDSAENMHF